MLPLASSDAICSWLMARTALFTSFMSLPNFLPITRKLHFTFLTSCIPEPSSMNESSLTLVSASITLLIRSIRLRRSASPAGIEIVCRACITGIFTFLRRESTIEVTCIATCIACSSSVSIYDSFASGNLARCTLIDSSRFVTSLRSLNNWSA